jgi:hypothetical protein
VRDLYDPRNIVVIPGSQSISRIDVQPSDRHGHPVERIAIRSNLDRFVRARSR